MKILVPTDFSDNARNAFEFAKKLALLNKASITLLFAYHNVYDFAALSSSISVQIEEDAKKAMEELHRVLKPNGTCIIQTPFKEGKIYEDFSKKTLKDRLGAFGQEDHVRIYSVAGIEGRLKENGFQNVEIKTFPKEERYGFMEETILIARK